MKMDLYGNLTALILFYLLLFVIQLVLKRIDEFVEFNQMMR